MSQQENIEDTQKKISLFPLPSTVLFPYANLPLHIFEPRYREMVSDSLDNNQLIGMVLLKPGWRKDYLNSPEIEPIGCAGEIQDCHRLEDGKFNLILHGLNRFKILQEIGDKAYRQANVQFLKEKNDLPIEELSKPRFELLRTRIQEYIQLLPKDNPQKESMKIDSCISIGHLMDQIIFFSEMSHENKQPFLEELDVMNRLKIIQPFLDRKISFLRRSKFLFEKGVDVSLN